MKNKKKNFTKIAFFTVVFFQQILLNAQIVGADAFIKGSYVEIAISGEGGYEGVNSDSTSVPLGMHQRSGTMPMFGFVANPQMNLWTTYDGDYYAPGAPENGWGFEIDTSGGIVGSNNAMKFLSFPNSVLGSITNYSHIGSTYNVDWEGDYTSGTNLHFKINYKLEESDIFYITTITITNNTIDTIPDLYYYRNIDPDNNEILTTTFQTTNTIVSQHVIGTSSVANVTATQNTPWFSYLGLVAIDTADWRAGYGFFQNRYASNMYYGFEAGAFPQFVQAVGSTHYYDEAIFLAHRTQNLIPAASQTFRFATVFNPSAVICLTTSTPVSFAPLANICQGAPSFILSGGSPAGGVYSGIGVVNDSVFDSSISGSGLFTIVYTYTDTNSCNESVSQTIQVNDCTGLPAIASSEFGIQIYPNPFNDIFDISNYGSKGAVITIYNTLGQKIYSVNSNKEKTQIDLSAYQKGIYFVEVKTENGITTKRIIKK